MHTPVNDSCPRPVNCVDPNQPWILKADTAYRFDPFEDTRVPPYHRTYDERKGEVHGELIFDSLLATYIHDQRTKECQRNSNRS